MKKLLLILVCFAFLAGTQNAFALNQSLWDLSATQGDYGITAPIDDADQRTEFFNQIDYIGNTTSVLNADGSFLDSGNLIITGFPDNSSSVEGFRSDILANLSDPDDNINVWEAMVTWDDLAGGSIAAAIAINTDDQLTITNYYTSGTLSFLVDEYDGFGDATIGDVDEVNNYGTSDDTGFDGETVATLEIRGDKTSFNTLVYDMDRSVVGNDDAAIIAAFIAGTINPFNDNDGLTINSGYYHLEGQFSDIIDNFWYFADGTAEGVEANTLGLDLIFSYTDGTNTSGQIDLVDDGNPDLPNSINSRHTGSIFVSVVPEPGTMMLVGFGLLGLAGISRRKL